MLYCKGLEGVSRRDLLNIISNAKDFQGDAFGEVVVAYISAERHSNNRGAFIPQVLGMATY